MAKRKSKPAAKRAPAIEAKAERMINRLREHYCLGQEAIRAGGVTRQRLVTAAASPAGIAYGGLERNKLHGQSRRVHAAGTVRLSDSGRTMNGVQTYVQNGT